MMSKVVSQEAKKVNRLFLGLVVISACAPWFLSGLFAPGGIFENAGVNQETIVSEMLLFLIAAAFIGLGGRAIFESVQLGNVSVGSLIWIMVLSFLVQPVMSWLNMITMAFVENYVAASVVRTSSSFLINLLYLALTPALVEELIFRGLIYHGLRSVGRWKAVLLSALMFGLMHLNINQFVYAFLLGIVLALVVEITGSLYSSILLHFMINSRSVIYLASEEMVNALLTQTANPVEYTSAQYLASAAVYTPAALICAFGVWGVLRRLSRSCGKETLFADLREERGEKGALSPGFATPAFWIGLILSVAYIIWFDLLR